MKLEFPLLTPEQIEVKVKQVTEKGAVLLLYKDARTDMNILDEVVGPMNWQPQYREVKGNLYCSIGIYNDERSEWVWKEDCGIESRPDGDGNEKKGEASDAFKRAGFRWGIGRELYTAPFVFVRCETVPKQGGRGFEMKDRFARFSVRDIDYDDHRRIKKLVIVDNKDIVAFTHGDSKKTPAKKKTAQEPAQEGARTVLSDTTKARLNGAIKEYARMAGVSIAQVVKQAEQELKQHIGEIDETGASRVLYMISQWAKALAPNETGVPF